MFCNVKTLASVQDYIYIHLNIVLVKKKNLRFGNAYVLDDLVATNFIEMS